MGRASRGVIARQVRPSGLVHATALTSDPTRCQPTATKPLDRAARPVTVAPANTVPVGIGIQLVPSAEASSSVDDVPGPSTWPGSSIWTASVSRPGRDCQTRGRGDGLDRAEDAGIGRRLLPSGPPSIDQQPGLARVAVGHDRGRSRPPPPVTPAIGPTRRRRGGRGSSAQCSPSVDSQSRCAVGPPPTATSRVESGGDGTAASPRTMASAAPGWGRAPRAKAVEGRLQLAPFGEIHEAGAQCEPVQVPPTATRPISSGDGPFRRAAMAGDEVVAGAAEGGRGRQHGMPVDPVARRPHGRGDRRPVADPSCRVHALIGGGEQGVDVGIVRRRRSLDRHRSGWSSGGRRSNTTWPPGRRRYRPRTARASRW